ncbi:hypothetical protein M427DRAFT_67174 [Gonapodya prolifera JEL478]|uniref:Uncharacterized protein n=1 Tax=Gonapodya prolifera (strain JEL478) TaxID=1344416 RepID=A0A139AS42_GONPJ|nr:hypothetical protein M427DRAFT_67174 [Gonapodya prolifera JEL478]|eukprot:KXS19557.1 hypothetical protein M427DRAFT_67174 [Gonapodya prolifera JEL478]
MPSGPSTPTKPRRRVSARSPTRRVTGRWVDVAKIRPPKSCTQTVLAPTATQTRGIGSRSRSAGKGGSRSALHTQVELHQAPLTDFFTPLPQPHALASRAGEDGADIVHVIDENEMPRDGRSPKRARRAAHGINSISTRIPVQVINVSSSDSDDDPASPPFSRRLPRSTPHSTSSPAHHGHPASSQTDPGGTPPPRSGPTLPPSSSHAGGSRQAESGSFLINLPPFGFTSPQSNTSLASLPADQPRHTDSSLRNLPPFGFTSPQTGSQPVGSSHPESEYLPPFGFTSPQSSTALGIIPHDQPSPASPLEDHPSPASQQLDEDDDAMVALNAPSPRSQALVALQHPSPPSQASSQPPIISVVLHASPHPTPRANTPLNDPMDIPARQSRLRRTPTPELVLPAHSWPPSPTSHVIVTPVSGPATAVNVGAGVGVAVEVGPGTGIAGGSAKAQAYGKESGLPWLHAPQLGAGAEGHDAPRSAATGLPQWGSLAASAAASAIAVPNTTPSLAAPNQNHNPPLYAYPAFLPPNPDPYILAALPTLPIPDSQTMSTQSTQSISVVSPSYHASLPVYVAPTQSLPGSESQEQEQERAPRPQDWLSFSTIKETPEWDSQQSQDVDEVEPSQHAGEFVVVEATPPEMLQELDDLGDAPPGRGEAVPAPAPAQDDPHPAWRDSPPTPPLGSAHPDPLLLLPTLAPTPIEPLESSPPDLSLFPPGYELPRWALDRSTMSLVREWKEEQEVGAGAGTPGLESFSPPDPALFPPGYEFARWALDRSTQSLIREWREERGLGPEQAEAHGAGVAADGQLDVWDVDSAE